MANSAKITCRMCLLVCLPMGSGGGVFIQVTITHDALDLTVQGPHPNILCCQCHLMLYKDVDSIKLKN